MPRRAILTISEDTLVLYEDEEVNEAEDAIRGSSNTDKLPTMSDGLHSLAEFFTGLRILRAEDEGSRSSCKLVTGEHDAELAALGVVEGGVYVDEAGVLFALRDFLRDHLKTSELAELHMAAQRGSTEDLKSGRGSPSGGGKPPADALTVEVDPPPDPFGGDVNMNAVANKLAGLAAMFSDASFNFEENPPRESFDFYESAGGNESLAAGMFDLSVVIDELVMDGPVGDQSGFASDAGKSVGGTKPPRPPRPAKPLPRGLTLLSVDDNYRPRTSSKATEPQLPQPHGITLLSVDDNYRPRTSSRAPLPEPNMSTSPPAAVSPSPLSGGSSE
jgi:hypothetical protein